MIINFTKYGLLGVVIAHAQKYEILFAGGRRRQARLAGGADKISDIVFMILDK